MKAKGRPKTRWLPLQAAIEGNQEELMALLLIKGCAVTEVDFGMTDHEIGTTRDLQARTVLFFATKLKLRRVTPMSHEHASTTPMAQ